MTSPRQVSDALPTADRAIKRKGTMFSARRRRPGGRASIVLTLVAVVALPALLAGTGDGPNHQAADAQPRVPADEVVTTADMAPEGSAPVEQTPEVSPFASTASGLVLSLPSDRVLLAGFHEASFTHSLPLTPVGRCKANENRTEASCPPDVQEGPEYVILSSRGRVTSGTTAVDLVMRDEDPVISPISGEVVEVRPYSLYGKYPDHRIELVPDGHPDLRIVLIHVRDVHVAAGYRVVAGKTELAGGPNRFPFASHIDRYFPTDRWPHVHLEVKSVQP